MKNQETKKEMIAVFHTGRGGRFNNGGYKRAMAIFDNFNPQHYGVDLYEVESDKGEIMYVFDNGEEACTKEELNANRGVLEIDGIYSTYSWLPVSELSDDEIEIIVRDLRPWEYEKYINIENEDE